MFEPWPLLVCFFLKRRMSHVEPMNGIMIPNRLDTMIANRTVPKIEIKKFRTQFATLLSQTVHCTGIIYNHPPGYQTTVCHASKRNKTNYETFIMSFDHVQQYNGGAGGWCHIYTFERLRHILTNVCIYNIICVGNGRTVRCTRSTAVFSSTFARIAAQPFDCCNSIFMTIIV